MGFKEWKEKRAKAKELKQKEREKAIKAEQKAEQKRKDDLLKKEIESEKTDYEKYFDHKFLEEKNWKSYAKDSKGNITKYTPFMLYDMVKSKVEIKSNDVVLVAGNNKAKLTEFLLSLLRSIDMQDFDSMKNIHFYLFSPHYNKNAIGKILLKMLQKQNQTKEDEKFVVGLIEAIKSMTISDPKQFNIEKLFKGLKKTKGGSIIFIDSVELLGKNIEKTLATINECAKNKNIAFILTTRINIPTNHWLKLESIPFLTNAKRNCDEIWILEDEVHYPNKFDTKDMHYSFKDVNTSSLSIEYSKEGYDGTWYFDYFDESCTYSIGCLPKMLWEKVELIWEKTVSNLYNNATSIVKEKIDEHVRWGTPKGEDWTAQILKDVEKMAYDAVNKWYESRPKTLTNKLVAEKIIKIFNDTWFSNVHLNN